MSNSSVTWTCSALYPRLFALQPWTPANQPVPCRFGVLRGTMKENVFKGLINCDRPPSAASDVTQGVATASSKGCFESEDVGEEIWGLTTFPPSLSHGSQAPLQEAGRRL
ncbi:hypothetical protein SKAU_G00066290 [Synaphobranchus kaupii]|uniref:Uncharacterized protein n=1 Tax=Synaphobranchus kaupii TaxID=118154 RepID=A0A9Q1J930_SYNKA|nr:hypothetical protein SKAU_G00066290 [Synaphobranchus kaupii]